ncbi:MAG: hypothetical protein AB7K04_14600 [Pseudorhodoplanes sp.]
MPYRLLEEAPELSAGDPNTGNMLIQGDNLDALKALLPFYAGQVKCIYIDPPFRDGMYADQRRHRYTGRFRFAKHFLGADAVPAFDGTEAGEEFQCAQALDSLPQVKFWIRNVARHPQSFWLPTASDKFYPDFVALLNDGRFFVIEYKGALLAGAGVDDTNEKRAIGRLWESRSGGKGAFLVVEKVIDGRDMRAQMLDKVGGAQ